MRTHFVHLILGSGLLLALAIGADESLTEAPAGFDTPTLAARPGSESSSNGIAEPPGDSFAQDQQAFETPHDATTGLGPVYNATSCSGCHQNPVTGGPSQITEIRAGHRDENGNFVNPSVSINDGANVIICPQAQEHLPEIRKCPKLASRVEHAGRWFCGGGR